jgi:hypothetical protein
LSLGLSTWDYSRLYNKDDILEYFEVFKRDMFWGVTSYFGYKFCRQFEGTKYSSSKYRSVFLRNVGSLYQTAQRRDTSQKTVGLFLTRAAAIGMSYRSTDTPDRPTEYHNVMSVLFYDISNRRSYTF